MSPDIAYIVSHGFAARMLIQTDLLGLLRKSGRSVALICPDASDENLLQYCSSKDVQLVEFNPTSSFWTRNYHFARKYFLEDIRSNTALWEKHVWATRFATSNNIWFRLRPYLLLVAFYLCRWFPWIGSVYRRREKKYLRSKKAAALIHQLKPGVLISTYPVNFSEGMLLTAARSQGAKTIIHLLSWDNISCKGHFPCLADEYVAWGPIMKEELMAYYDIRSTQIQECGVPHFDVHVRSKNAPNPGPYLTDLGLSADHPYLFVGMSSPRFAPKEIDIVEWLALQVQENVFGTHMQLVIRPHPQNVQGNMADLSWLPRLQALKGSRVGVDFPDMVKSQLPWSMQTGDMIRLSHLLAGCVVCLNSGSTLSIDALMCEKPVILTSFDGSDMLEYWRSAKRLVDYPHLQKLIALGGVDVAYSYEELTRHILLYLADPSHNLSKRRTTIARQCLSISGSATQRVLDCLINLSSDEASKRSSFETTTA